MKKKIYIIILVSIALILLNLKASYSYVYETNFLLDKKDDLNETQMVNYLIKTYGYNNYKKRAIGFMNNKALKKEGMIFKTKLTYVDSTTSEHVLKVGTRK